LSLHPSEVIESSSDIDTAAAGRLLAASLVPGGVVILSGPLGAGKTVFVRGLAEGLGLDPRDVHSPSFTIVSEHGPGPGGWRLVHVDLYRVDDPAEIEDLGLGDYLSAGCVMAVEWGDKLPSGLRAGAVRVVIEDGGAENRTIKIQRP
jgi:tRNA threonylcarbamoyladenosine biosynthesis protein TsaE